MRSKILLSKNIGTGEYSFRVQIHKRLTTSHSAWKIDCGSDILLKSVLEDIWKRQGKQWWEFWK